MGCDKNDKYKKYNWKNKEVWVVIKMINTKNIIGKILIRGPKLNIDKYSKNKEKVVPNLECPKCKSKNTRYKVVDDTGVLMKCYNCGHKWNENITF